MKQNEEWPIRLIGGERNRYVCHYCGQAAETLDHVPPRASWRTDCERFRVPSCNECNCLAGDTFHATFAERAEYIKARLSRRYAKALEQPEWTASELRGMGATMRKAIKQAMALKTLVRSRVAFRP